MPRARQVVCVLLAMVAALAASTRAGGQPAAETPLARKLFRALTVPHVDLQRSAALAVDLATGATVFSYNDARSLVPASNQKLVVTYAALLSLGPAFRIATDVLGEGELDGTTWRGDLVLKGRGDPTLTSAGLRALAAQVRASGVRRVTGRVLGDESFFDTRRTAPGWKSWFFVNESPPLSALVVNRGRFRGVVSPTPALSAALAFRRALRSAGIAVQGTAAVGRAEPGAFPLASLLSPPLTTILRYVGVESDNFAAELLLKQLGVVGARRGTTAAGASVARRVLAAEGIPLAGVTIVDGSGLSRLNRLTAQAVVAILRRAWADPELRPIFLATLAVAGRSGTLEDRMRRLPALGNVLAKTGTTSLASALSGFVRRRFVFAVLQNGRPLSLWWARRAQDKFASVLAAQ